MLTNAPPTPRRYLALCQANSRFSVNACWEEGKKEERERRKEEGGMEGRKNGKKEGERKGERRKEGFTVVRVS